MHPFYFMLLKVYIPPDNHINHKVYIIIVEFYANKALTHDENPHGSVNFFLIPFPIHE